MGARIIVNGEFQHHGIMGQRWGVITRNVGVNYIPIGGRNSSAKDVAKKVGAGVSSFAKTTASKTADSARAIVKGAKKMKADHDAKKIENQKSAFKNGKKLSKKDIAKMSYSEIQEAINRRTKENELYKMEHPQIAAGKEFFSKYVADAVMDAGGQFVKKIIGMKLESTVRDYIKNNDHYSEDQKRDLLERLKVEQLSDRLARESYENRIRTENERAEKLKNMNADIEYQAKTQEAMRKAIDNSSLSEDAKLKLYEQNGLLTGTEKAANSARARINESNAIRSLLDDPNLSDADKEYLKDQYNLRSGTDKALKEYESKTKATDAIRSRIREKTADGSQEQLEAFVRAGVATKRESELYNRKSYSNDDRMAIRESIDSSDLPFLAKLQEKVRAGVATPAEEMNVREYEQYIRQGSIKRAKESLA